jgi:hypothetical protein
MYHSVDPSVRAFHIEPERSLRSLDHFCTSVAVIDYVARDFFGFPPVVLRGLSAIELIW